MALLKVKEIVDRLKVSQACVYQMIAERKIAHVRIGVGRGAIRVGEEDLQAFLDGCKVEQAMPGHRELKHIKLGA